MQRNNRHNHLSVFLGRWSARGTSYGGTDQTADEPWAKGEPWLSTHEAYWHTGRFFVIQDERADIAGSRFDTLSLIGLNEDGRYFARSIENHGFYRDYHLNHDGDLWKLSGETERATIRFENNSTEQVISWEWRRDGAWLPLCDRTAVKIDP